VLTISNKAGDQHDKHQDANDCNKNDDGKIVADWGHKVIDLRVSRVTHVGKVSKSNAYLDLEGCK
jgi:hypothetical protein